MVSGLPQGAEKRGMQWSVIWRVCASLSSDISVAYCINSVNAIFMCINLETANVIRSRQLHKHTAILHALTLYQRLYTINLVNTAMFWTVRGIISSHENLLVSSDQSQRLCSGWQDRNLILFQKVWIFFLKKPCLTNCNLALVKSCLFWLKIHLIWLEVPSVQTKGCPVENEKSRFNAKMVKIVGLELRQRALLYHS